jgi:Acetyltransferase (GNAT) domain
MNVATPNYVSRANLDLQKWDACIGESENGLIYGYSFYLDKMARNWDALIWNDYSAVMPLTWNRKAGIFYLYQPAFTPNLGVFGKQLSKETVSRFIKSIPAKFQLVEINLNAANLFENGSKDDIEWMKRRNYVLSLNKTYDQLYTAYNDNIKRNIKKCLSLGCRYANDISIEQIIGLAKNQLNRLTHLKQQDFHQFKLLFDELAKKKQAKTYGVYLNDDLISSAAFFFSNGRAFYILVGNHPNGKTVGASHYLIDRFIADHAGQPLLLDFEGSDIDSLAFFYGSFGAGLEYYPSLKMNHLPWYIKWLK